MDQILDTLRSAGINPEVFIKTTAIVTLGVLLLSCLIRLIFGRRSNLSHALSSAIGILFVYVVAVVVHSIFSQWEHYIPPLPYVTYNGSNLVIFSFSGAHYTAVCSQILSMVILAFLANLLDSLITSRKNVLSWFASKCLTILLAIGLQWLANWLIRRYFPTGIITYAPTILLGLLILLISVGSLKFLAGIILSEVHPVVGAFFTFFFVTLTGKALTRAVLTAGILTCLVLTLAGIGCSIISIASAALIAYIPLLTILAAQWFLINKIL